MLPANIRAASNPGIEIQNDARQMPRRIAPTKAARSRRRRGQRGAVGEQTFEAMGERFGCEAELWNEQESRASGIFRP